MSTRNSRTQNSNIPQPFIVKLEDKATKSSIPILVEIVTAVIIFILVVCLILWVAFSSYKFKSTSTSIPAIPTSTSSPPVIPLSVKVTLDMPSIGTVRDALPVTVTLVNTGDSAINLTATLSTVSVNDMILADGGTSTVKIENLPPNSTFTHTFNIILLDAPINDSLDFSVTLNEFSTNQSISLTNVEWKVFVWSWLPHIRAIVNFILAGSGLVSGLIAIFSGSLKKALKLE